VTEGNAAYDCTFPIYEDSSATRDQVYRNNYYSGGLYGANVNLAPGRGFTGNPISAVARPDAVGQPKWVRVTCLNNTFIRWLKDGDVVYLEGILEPGQPANSGVFIGRFTIRNVNQGSNTFDYDTKTVPAGNPSLGTFPLPNFFYVFRWPRIVFESCQFDDWVRRTTSFGFSRGILGAPADDSATGPNVILPDWLVRENAFRHVDGIPSEVASDQAVVIANTDGAVVDSNLISLSGTPLVEYKRAQNVMAFGNRTETGAWIRGWFAPTGQYLEDITTRIEDVTSICL
jgi:hypothetical protein